jgi:hypothetical protein
VREAADLERLLLEVESIERPEAALLDIRLNGLLPPGAQALLTRLHELGKARFCYARLENSLLPSPTDDEWMARLPPGVLREVAERLRRMAAVASNEQAPDVAPPVAARAMLELYALAAEQES